MHRRAWQWMFAVAALWNLAIGLAFALEPAEMLRRSAKPAAGSDSSISVATLSPEITPTEVWLARDFGVCVAIFGIGYAMVSISPERHSGILVLGIIGKTYVVLMGGYRLLTGQVAASLAIPFAGDGLFAVLFLIYLLGPSPLSAELPRRAGKAPT